MFVLEGFVSYGILTVLNLVGPVRKDTEKRRENSKEISENKKGTIEKTGDFSVIVKPICTYLEAT